MRPLLGDLEEKSQNAIVGSTCWLANGTRASNFLPTWWKLRLSADISVELRIGPSDCEQRAEFSMFTWVAPSLPSTGSTTSRWLCLFAGAEWICAVAYVLRTAIPEVAEVENCIHRAGCVAARYPACIDSLGWVSLTGIGKDRLNRRSRGFHTGGD